jgi:hypothetical protein
MLVAMDSLRRRPRSRLTTSRFRPSAGGGAVADLVELNLPSLRVVPDIAVPSALGERSRLTDHASLAAALYARSSRTTANRPPRFSDHLSGGNL